MDEMKELLKIYKVVNDIAKPNGWRADFGPSTNGRWVTASSQSKGINTNNIHVLCDVKKKTVRVVLNYKSKGIVKIGDLTYDMGVETRLEQFSKISHAIKWLLENKKKMT